MKNLIPNATTSYPNLKNVARSRAVSNLEFIADQLEASGKKDLAKDFRNQASALLLTLCFSNDVPMPF